ncbi:MAG: stage III sporulation protein AF [Clostridiales bacterium]|nr:stage III sporulation protein AF [Clostridiales bacterium]
MEVLRKWGIMLCTASVASAVICFIVPKGKMERAVKTVLSLFMLTVIVWPLSYLDGGNIFDIDTSFEIEEYDEEKYYDEIKEYAVRVGEENVKNSLDEILKELCSYAYSIEVQMYINDEDNPELSEISIELSSEDSALQGIIREKVSSETGIIPEIIIASEN